jgi:hypothetical protein
MQLRGRHINRRDVVQLVSPFAWIAAVRASAYGACCGEPLVTTADIPLELAGNWRQSAATGASAVIARMREACLSDIQPHSDRQPERLRVDDHRSGPPAIWLHSDPATTAWIIVDVGTRDWCNLAYQFGHELGHVVANSWARDAKPGGPCQGLEETLVEAFSFRGLGRLAESWRARAPFPNDNAYADSILDYRDRSLQPDWEASARTAHSCRVEAMAQPASGLSGDSRLGGFGSAHRPDGAGPLRRGFQTGGGSRCLEPLARTNPPRPGAISTALAGKLRRDRHAGPSAGSPRGANWLVRRDQR